MIISSKFGRVSADRGRYSDRALACCFREDEIDFREMGRHPGSPVGKVSLTRQPSRLRSARVAGTTAARAEFPLNYQGMFVGTIAPPAGGGGAST